MIQEEEFIYDTIYATGAGNNNVTIKVQPGSVAHNTIAAVLLLQVGKTIINKNVGIEGDLIMELRNTLKDISFEIDNDGNLIINAVDAANYSIDDEGNLIYTFR